MTEREMILKELEKAIDEILKSRKNKKKVLEKAEKRNCTLAYSEKLREEIGIEAHIYLTLLGAKDLIERKIVR